MDPQTSAPPVVAVVVTCDPGLWLEDTLAALAAQDYPSLSVLVIDTASVDDPTSRIAAVLPDAYVRRVDRRGFARAANDVLTVVEGASHFLFCHDDAAPAPDTVRLLVEEAFRSNAGIVCPKLVEWDRPDRLLAVGLSADKQGFPVDLVERGELDQEQHDAVRDVFVAPGGATLVRADLFSALGGFDPVIDLFGEDLNLSWRAQLAGARVMVNPAARVRHREALRRGERAGWDGPDGRLEAHRLGEEHRLRTLLTCYGRFRLLRLLPQAVLMSVAEAGWHLLAGRPAFAIATLRAWPAALRESGLADIRRATQAKRSLPDAELRRLQARASSRLRAEVRSRLHKGGLGPGLAESISSRDWRLAAGAWVGVLIVLAAGSRSLLGAGIPGVGHLPVTSAGPGHWWRLWAAGWRPGGLGSAAPSPPALALLGLAGGLLLGATGSLQHLLVLGPLVLGPLGAYRAARMFPSRRGQVLALVLYAAAPVSYNALAGGRWAGLVVYAAAPWLLAGLCRSWGPARGEPAFLRFVTRRSVSLGLLIGVTGALAPPALVLVPLVGAGLALGGLAVGRGAGAARTAAVALGSSAVGAALLLPWSFDTFGSRTALFGVPGDPAHPPGLGQLLAFHTGPVGVNWLNWALPVAAALPLVIGTSWRLEWAARCWGVAVVGWGVAWAAGRGWIGVPLPVPEVTLSVVAAALSLSAAIGVVAFELDLARYRFGLRQLAATVAGAAVVVSMLPTLVAATGGRWHLPRRDFASTLGFAAPQRAAGGFRMLWVGDPNALPLGSWRLADGVGYATSDSRLPDVADQWPAASAGATPLLATDLRLASQGRTTRLGHLLAPLAVRYLIIPVRLAASGSGVPRVAAPMALLQALAVQEDLRAVSGDEALVIYQNTAWAPSRAVLPPAAVAASRSADPAAAQDVSLDSAEPVLPGGLADRFHGRVPGPSEVYVASSSSGRWRLSVNRRAGARRPAFGWAMAFAVPGSGGQAVLVYRAAPTRDLALGLEVALWLVAVAGLIRRGRPAGSPLIVDEPGTPGPGPVRPAPRRARHEAETAAETSEELWPS
jgi:GT2 family glycosyltransferase